MSDEVLAMIQPHLAYISATPKLFWKLMDIRLMPEQIQTEEDARRLVHVVKEWKEWASEPALP